MTDFDPKWPHGHMLRDGRKAEILRTLDDGCHVVLVEGGDRQRRYSGIWPPDGRSVVDDMSLINAPAPKLGGKLCVLRDKHGCLSCGHFVESPMGIHPEVIAIVDWVEGQGMGGDNG